MTDEIKDPYPDEGHDHLFEVKSHRMEHEDLHGRDGNPTSITMEISQATAVKGAIKIVTKTAAKEVHLTRDDGWSKTIRRGALWVYGSGLIISKSRSTFRDAKTFDDLKIDAPGFLENDWCYHLTNIDHAMDFMGHNYITYSQPALHKVFKEQTAFIFHTHARPPTIPNWVDAEIYGGFEGHMALFGERASQ